MNRRNRDADILSHRLDRAATTIESVLDHLNDQRALVMAGGSSGGEGGRQVGTHSDPTLRSVAKLDTIDQHRRDIIDALASINIGVNLLDECCRNALGARARPAEASAPARSSEAEPKCTGGDPSTWGDPTCGQIANWTVGDSGHIAYDRDGLCPRHIAKRADWLREDGERRANESNARRLRRHNSKTEDAA